MAVDVPRFRLHGFADFQNGNLPIVPGLHPIDNDPNTFNSQLATRAGSRSHNENPQLSSGKTLLIPHFLGCSNQKFEALELRSCEQIVVARVRPASFIGGIHRMPANMAAQGRWQTARMIEVYTRAEEAGRAAKWLA